jgi:hypothetical protein
MGWRNSCLWWIWNRWLSVPGTSGRRFTRTGLLVRQEAKEVGRGIRLFFLALDENFVHHAKIFVEQNVTVEHKGAGNVWVAEVHT